MSTQQLPPYVGRACWWTPARIVDAIRLHVTERGEPPQRIDWSFATVEHPCHNTIYRFWASWDDAVRAAGFEPRRYANARRVTM
jgi:hypothetical protein